MDITDLISHIKGNVYSMINLKSQKFSKVDPNINDSIPSLLSNCKKTFDDLKRVDSLL